MSWAWYGTYQGSKQSVTIHHMRVQRGQNGGQPKYFLDVASLYGRKSMDSTLESFLLHPYCSAQVEQKYPVSKVCGFFIIRSTLTGELSAKGSPARYKPGKPSNSQDNTKSSPYINLCLTALNILRLWLCQFQLQWSSEFYLRQHKQVLYTVTCPFPCSVQILYYPLHHQWTTGTSYKPH